MAIVHLFVKPKCLPLLKNVLNAQLPLIGLTLNVCTMIFVLKDSKFTKLDSMREMHAKVNLH